MNTLALDRRHDASQQAGRERGSARGVKLPGAGVPRFLQQRALEVDAPHSPFEREADAVADRVMAMPDRARGLGGAGDDSLRGSAEPATGGAPLALAQRAFFEPRLGADLSPVRVHTDPGAAAAARAIGAKAFAHGTDIYFGAGRYAPHTNEGRRLLAHELAHTRQASRPGLLQADFESDFASRSEVRVADNPVRPPGTVLVTNAAGEKVFAPYGIYRPQEVPAQYRDQTMRSTKAFQWRNPTLPIFEAMQLELARGEAAAGTLSVRDMQRLAEVGHRMDIRLMMARVDNGYQFVGYDMSQAHSTLVTQGFVESQEGTGRVGRALFADRVVRALESGVPEMDLVMYTSRRTETFHTDIYRVAGLSGRPSQDEHYRLSTRQMVRVALAWSDGLTEAQRFQLVPLAAGQREPSPVDAQRILGGARASGSGGAGPASGGFAPATMAEMQRFAERINRNTRRPAELERLEELQKREVQERVLREHAGFARLGSRLYRVQWEGDALRTTEVVPELIWQPVQNRPAPRRLLEPLLPFPLGPLPVGLDPVRRVRIGSTVLEPPTEVSVTAGDVVIVHSGLTFEARDARTGRPLIGTFEGGEWYRVVGPDGRSRAIEPITGGSIQRIQVGGRQMLVEPFGPQRYASPRGGPGAGVRGVAAGVGIIMVVNEILGPIGAALQNQRATIKRGRAEIDLWTGLGADPLYGVWDLYAKGPAPRGTEPDTAILGTWYYPYVVDIDADKLRAELPRRVRSYYELQVLLTSGQSLGAIQKHEGRWYAVVNRPSRTDWKPYDITEAITTIESLTLGAAAEGLREQLAARPESERKGRIFRIKQGANLYRSRGGRFLHQPLYGAGDLLGPNALVREIRRTDFWVATDRMFVEPVNADAYRAVALANYKINESIEDVWREVEESGREVKPAKLPRFRDGPLNHVTAGPETTGEQRFGFTTYTRSPQASSSWTLAQGEIRKFWVSVDDVTRVKDEDVAAYLNQ